ncbi:MAG: hypothetical protein Q8O60_04850, partial [Deltaproteobacteria bacterium]|nr:hypothetical protein [Deltaproteobacteria bacterium]
MRRLRLIVSTFVFISVILVSRTAAPYPGWYDPTTQRGIKPGIPDFYQKQKAEWGDLWCGPTAAANCLWYWDDKGYGDLAEDSGDWLNDSNKLIEDLATSMRCAKGSGVNWTQFNEGLEKYIKDKECDPAHRPMDGLVVHSFREDSLGPYRNLFEAYQQE